MTISLALAWGCSTAQDRLGVAIDNQPPPVFVTEDAGGDADASDFVNYCPSNKCPPGWTTCPTSLFPCDVNLLSDVNNCGACGSTCPPGLNEKFSCDNGACKMACEKHLDCDGIVDNGCEISPVDDKNCGACGKECKDPDKRCVYQGQWGNSPTDCGCPDGKASCDASGQCYDLKADDTNCGACGTQCDPTNGGKPALANAKYGCGDGKCGALKCTGRFANCDGNVENGCETSIVADDNCGSCGVVCPAGTACRIDSATSQPMCACPTGLTYCQNHCEGDVCFGSCVDLTTDYANCGACGAYCSYLNGTPRTCNFGSCEMRCREGQADCNNSQSDGCEVNTNSDPHNCGGCGQVCDAVAGQACVAGRCVVEPCDQDAGELAR
ncbi:hypothetical protein [Labilithrix luteola]|nr:hypothetical protein [Labilithrix luteola]